MIIWWIVGAVVVILLVYIAAVYNRFIVLKNGIESNFKQIQVALKKRLDLITQAVQAVKGEMKFENETMTEIAKLRSQNIESLSPQQLKEADNLTGRFLSGFKVQLERYPDLKSNESVQKILQNIEDLENEISRMRYVYNNTIQEFNTKVQMFPTNIIAKMFGFSKQKYLKFENEDELEKAPDVDLNF